MFNHPATIHARAAGVVVIGDEPISCKWLRAAFALGRVVGGLFYSKK